MSEERERDKWADWVLNRSFGGDTAQQERWLSFLRPIRDRVVRNAAIRDGDVLLDVGTGDGLIGFGAMSLVGSGRVIFSDISPALVDACRTAARELGVLEHADFVQATADDLRAIPDASVDVVTTRSVLIYVDDKAAALREFHRVLRAGGRVSIFEPINNYFPWDSSDFWGHDATPVRDLVEKIWTYEEWGEETDASDPMMNFDERDLVGFAESAGFAEVHAELVVDVEPSTWFEDWTSMLDVAPNPNAHTIRESIEGALTPEERARFEAHLKPLADARRAVNRSAFAYLWLLK